MDKEAIRLKYAKERDKRLRADGNAQYITLDGQLSYYKTDPYVDFKERKPVNDHVRFCYVGGGFAGLCTGAGVVVPGATSVSKPGCSALAGVGVGRTMLFRVRAAHCVS